MRKLTSEKVHTNTINWEGDGEACKRMGCSVTADMESDHTVSSATNCVIVMLF